MPRKKYRFSTLADFLATAIENKIAPSEVNKIIEDIRGGVGLAKRDRELARFMQDGPPSLEDDPIFARGFAAGYSQAQDDHKQGVDILAVGADPEDHDTSGEPYDPTSPVNIAAHAEARKNRTGCYAPGASDDPDKDN